MCAFSLLFTVLSLLLLLFFLLCFFASNSRTYKHSKRIVLQWVFRDMRSKCPKFVSCSLGKMFANLNQWHFANLWLVQKPGHEYKVLKLNFDAIDLCRFSCTCTSLCIHCLNTKNKNSFANWIEVNLVGRSRLWWSKEDEKKDTTPRTRRRNRCVHMDNLLVIFVFI